MFTIILPHDTHKIKATKLHRNEILTDLGIEQRCARCGDYWPIEPGPDYIFFHKGSNKRGLGSYCNACELEYNKERRLKKADTPIKHYRLRDQANGVLIG